MNLIILVIASAASTAIVARLAYGRGRAWEARRWAAWLQACIADAEGAATVPAALELPGLTRFRGVMRQRAHPAGVAVLQANR